MKKLCSPGLVAALLAGVVSLFAWRAEGQYHPNTVGGLPIPDPAASTGDHSRVAAPFPPDLMERERKAFNEERRQRSRRTRRS